MSEECYICYENITNTEKKVLICKHQFHKLCINRWLENNITCPICRATIVDVKNYFPKFIKDLFKDFDQLKILTWKSNYLGYTGYIDNIYTSHLEKKIQIGIDCYKRPFFCFKGRIVFGNGKYYLQKSRKASVFFQRYSNDIFTYVFSNKTGNLLFDINDNENLKIIFDLQT
jgi:hypothetical protein